MARNYQRSLNPEELHCGLRWESLRVHYFRKLGKHYSIDAAEAQENADSLFRRIQEQ